ncbi:5-demethoxyubiquinol-8 5-hydroxylase UbiM [Sphingomonas sp. CJ20]
MECDVAIVGAGPAGLAFARSLAGTGLDVVLLERMPMAALANPAFDGREIALTHGSQAILERLGAWEQLPADAVSPLRAARVVNGGSRFALRFDPGARDATQLGYLVPNHAIRAALFAAVQGQSGLRIVPDAAVAEARADGRRAEVTLASGARVRARLLVVADSRMSETRDRLGIGADCNPLGRSMLVCRVRHAKPHRGVALEWFDHHRTLALLPLNDGMSSAVVTLPEEAARQMAALDDAALGRALTQAYRGRMGTMEVASTRHLYPLTTTWSHRFASGRAALIGDAAVGMHPVTAHGFNLGLRGQALLAALVGDAVRDGRDFGAPALLQRYATQHRAACRPLYSGTNLLVRLFTDERPVAQIARHAVLRLGAALPMVRPGVRAILSQ